MRILSSSEGHWLARQDNCPAELHLLLPSDLQASAAVLIAWLTRHDDHLGLAAHQLQDPAKNCHILQTAALERDHEDAGGHRKHGSIAGPEVLLLRHSKHAQLAAGMQQAMGIVSATPEAGMESAMACHNPCRMVLLLVVGSPEARVCAQGRSNFCLQLQSPKIQASAEGLDVPRTADVDACIVRCHG